MSFRVDQKLDVSIVEHPLIQEHLTILRDKNTHSHLFRHSLQMITEIVMIPVLSNLKLKDKTIETPFSKVTAKTVTNYPLFVSILRAGEGMVGPALKWLPQASVGMIGVFRDKNRQNQAVEYVCRLPPDISSREVIILDPLLATANTAVHVIARLKEKGAGPMQFVSLLSCERGIRKLKSQYPEVKLWTVSVEPEISDHDYLVPGVGDAGDRLFGT